jgi:membrane protease YdiL (CAAX protease family)
MKDNKIFKFTLFTFAFTWVFWIISFVILKQNSLPLFANESIFRIFEDGFINSTHLIATIIFSIGVYGPLIGYLIFQKEKKLNFGINKKILLLFIFGFPLLISILPGVLGSIISGSTYVVAFPLLSIFPYFIYQLLSSGTEEFGWRGFLLPEFLKEHTALESGWRSGWIWAIWHLPLVIFLYSELSVSIIIPTLIGFCFNIVGMAIIYSFLYVNSKSIIWLVIFHALSNTFSIFFLGSTENPIVGLLPAGIVWATVFILQKKFGEKLEV